MNSFLVAIQLVLFLGLVNGVSGAKKDAKECDLSSIIFGDCPTEPRKLSPLEQASLNVTCEDVKAWFKGSDKETNNKKYTLYARGFGVTLDTVPRFNELISHKTVLGRTEEPLSVPTEQFKGMIFQFNAKWNGKNYIVPCKSYPGMSVSINDDIKLIYGYDQLTNYYDTQGDECILKVTDNKSTDEYHLGLPDKCLTTFGFQEFPKSSSNSGEDKQINVPAKGWSNNKPQGDKGNKKGRRTQNKRH